MKKYLFILLVFAACQKEQQQNSKPIINLEKDQLFGYGHETFKGKPTVPPGRNKPKPVDTVIVVNPPPTDTTTQPPTNTNAFVVLVDFDGDTYTGAYWFNGYSAPADPSLDRAEVMASIRQNYAGYNIHFTESEYEYSQANIYNRQRLVITDTDNYGADGSGSGVAFVGSGFWGPEAGQTQNPPAYVYSGNLQNYEFYVAEIAAHEIGHTLRLVHVHLWNSDCSVSQTYLGGFIMGNGTYGGDSQWHPGHACRFQGGAYGNSDDKVLSEGVGRR